MMGSLFLGLTSILCILLNFRDTQAIVVGIDLGSEYTKVASAFPGRAYEVVLNAHSQRKTPTAVSFVGELREFGDAALGYETKNPYEVITSLINLIGKNITHLNDTVDEFNLLKLSENATTRLPLIHIESKNQTITPVIVLSHYLKFLQHMIAQSQPVSPKHLTKFDVVFTIPHSFGMKEKLALLDAAAISNLHVLKLVEETASAGLYHGIDLPVNYTGHKMILDVGSHWTQACVVTYNYTSRNLVTRERSVKILGCASTDQYGGRHFDVLLTKYLLDEAQGQFGKKNKWINPRVTQRFLHQAKNVKLILSTNKQAEFHIEDAVAGKDYHVKVTREKYEDLIKPRLKFLDQVIDQALQAANMSVHSLNGTELIGGSSRTPLIQKHLASSVLKSLELGQHLNSDEAPVLGAILMAANSSSIFRLRPIRFINTAKANYTLKVYLATDTTKPLREKNIISIGDTWTEGIRTFTLKKCDDLIAKLFEAKPNQPETLLFEYQITNIQKTCQTAPYNQLGLAKVGIQFNLNELGIIKLNRAVARWEQIVPVIINETLSTAITTENVNQTTNTSEEINMTQTSNTTDTNIPKNRTIEHAVLCDVQTTGSYALQMTESEIMHAKRSLKIYEAHDAQLLKLHQTKNQIEEKIYSLRNRLTEGNDLYSVTDKQFQAKAKEELEHFEEWLYSEGPTSTLEFLEAKMISFDAFIRPAEEKAEEVKNKEKAHSLIKPFIDSVEKDFFSLIASDEIEIPAEILEEFQMDFKKFKAWYDAVSEQTNSTEMLSEFNSTTQQFKSMVAASKRRIKTTPIPETNYTESLNDTLDTNNSTVHSLLDEL